MVLVTIFGIFVNNSICQQFQQFQCDGVRVNDYVRNVSDCRGWIRCKGDGVIATGLCPDSYYFNELRQKCTQDNSTCFKCPDSLGISNVYVENSCNRYIRCIRNIPTEQICEEGLQFNQDFQQCDLESVVGCTKKTTCSVNIPDGDFYAFTDPLNCSM